MTGLKIKEKVFHAWKEVNLAWVIKRGDIKYWELFDRIKTWNQNKFFDWAHKIVD
jgi:hypothetical protein